MNKPSAGSDIRELIDAWHKLLFSRKLEVVPHGADNITPIETRILMYIFSLGSVTIKDIASYLNVPNATLTNAIDRLEK